MLQSSQVVINPLFIILIHGLSFRETRAIYVINFQNQASHGREDGIPPLYPGILLPNVFFRGLPENQSIHSLKNQQE